MFQGLLEWDSVNDPDNDNFPKLGVGLLLLETISEIDFVPLECLTVEHVWYSISLS